jgi:hypothetical protein
LKVLNLINETYHEMVKLPKGDDNKTCHKSMLVFRFMGKVHNLTKEMHGKNIRELF